MWFFLHNLADIKLIQKYQGVWSCATTIIQKHVNTRRDPGYFRRLRASGLDASPQWAPAQVMHNDAGGESDQSPRHLWHGHFWDQRQSRAWDMQVQRWQWLTGWDLHIETISYPLSLQSQHGGLVNSDVNPWSNYVYDGMSSFKFNFGYELHVDMFAAEMMQNMCD